MSDVLERLKKACGFGDRTGTADGDINVMVRTVSIDLLKDAIKEIEFLRSVAGAVSQGEDFNQIADKAKAWRRIQP